MLNLCASDVVCWCVITIAGWSTFNPLGPTLPAFFLSYCTTPDFPVAAGKLMLHTDILLLPIAWDFVEKGQWLVWGQVGYVVGT